MEKQYERIDIKETVFVQWEQPRRFTVTMKLKDRMGCSNHKNIGVIADSVDRAIVAAQQAYPDYRIDSINDTGPVDIVVDIPKIKSKSIST